MYPNIGFLILESSWRNVLEGYLLVILDYFSKFHSSTFSNKMFVFEKSSNLVSNNEKMKKIFV